ncbi:MAG: hypothetical protein OXC48_05640, partial [Endozoicomonadaceae bacterium]|nr:hypothetical protein [Endozoicomonadaceae bacterium]
MSTETAEKNRIINNRKIRFNHFLLLSKKSFFYYNKLSVVALSIIFSFMMAITAGTSAFAGEDVTSSSGEQFTLYDYLNKHKNAPVELLNSLYYAVDSEPVTKSKSRFPFFTPVEYKEKSAALQRLPLHPLPEEKLNGLLSFRDVINYIDQKKLVPATNILIFNYLLTMYCTWYERDYNLPVAQTITIKGMLSDLEQQAQRKDDIAILILSFLKQPYCVNDIFARKSGQPFSVFLQKSMKNLFFPEPSFSEQLSMFLDNGYPSMAYTRWKRIPPLHKQYGHRKNHLFTSYEFDETGKDISSSSANLIPTAKEMNEIFNEYEEDQRISASTETRIKSAKGLTNLLFVAGVAFAQVVSANAASVPPRQQCEPGSNCQIQGPLSLYANNFYQMLEGNPRSNFQLGENIILNGKNHSSLYPFCSKPFSGSIQTGNYTLDVGDITDPLFGCTQNARLCGNFNLCPVNDTQGAVIARQVADGNLFNIQQTQWCDGPQRSLAEDIMGQGNEITFTGIKNATVMVAEGTGIIANKVSGDSNRITLKESGELFDAPLIHEVSGNENIFYQNAVSATTGTDSYFPDNKKIAAKHFTGTDNVVKQHGSHLTFVVDAAGQSQNPTITVNRRAPVLVASDTVMTLLSEQEKGSDNGLQGSGMTSNNDSTATSLICLEPDNSLNSLSFLSGELERKTNCSLSRCPLQWDVAGAASSTDLSTLCGGSKKIDTRTISGWLKAYAPHCLTEILHDDQCICYLPNEQLLGVVSTNNRSNEIWLTSRRTYTV